VAIAAPERSDSVLVEIDPSAPAAERADVRAALDADAVRPLVADWRVYELPAGVTLAQAERLLADEPAVRSVQLDALLHPLEIPDDPYFESQWSLPLITAPHGWDASTTAAPVIVAVIDTGVQTAHPELANRLWQNPGEIAGNGVDDDDNGHVDDVHGWNFYDNTSVLYSATDGDSHGTHVAGTIAAQRGNGQGVAGVADNARIMPLKFLKPGGGYTSDAIAAIQYARSKGATVINASWGGETYSQPLCDAIGLAGDAGILFVVAAGNGGSDAIGDDNDNGPSWPSNCPSPNLISVAAASPDDGQATFSNYGATTVDVGAPGVDILSTVPNLSFGYKSGTSMAAPHVSGVAAVVRGMQPGLAPWQVKASIMSGGVPAPALSGTTVSGRRVDLVGALVAAGTGVAPDLTPPDPFPALTPADGFGTSAPTGPTFTWAPSSDGQTGVTGYRLTVGGVVVATTGAGVRTATPALGEGVHSWTVSAVDGNGNLRTTAPRTLTIDRTAPTAPALQQPGQNGRVEGPSVTLTWAPSQDAVSGVASYRVLLDGVAVASVAAPGHSATVAMTRGNHTWQVLAIDGIGNQAASAPRAVTVGPSIPALGLSPRPQRLQLTAPSRLASGRTPALRVRLPRAMPVTVSIRRASGARALVRFRIRAKAGSTAIRFPARARATIRRPGTYVVSARASTRLRDSVRITIGPRR